MEWWEAPEYDERKAMTFGKAPKGGHARRVALTTDPVLVRTPAGGLRLTLRNRHPHESVRIFCGPTQRARC